MNTWSPANLRAALACFSALSTREMLGGAPLRLSRYLLDARCAGCASALLEAEPSPLPSWCASCYQSLAWLDAELLTFVTEREQRAVSVPLWLGTIYQSHAASCVRALKFQKQLWAARALSEVLLARWPQPGDLDVLCPMPLANGRLRARGFNQSLEIARHLAKQWQRPLLSNGLLRIRETQPQSELTAHERVSNMAGAFFGPTPLAGCHVGLVDDVLTTGATARQAALALHLQGARVTVIAVTRATIA